MHPGIMGEHVLNQEPIFLVGLHKSGTSLLRSLFDGHSQLFVIPIEAHFFRHLGFWMDYGIQRRLPQLFDKERMIQNLVDYIVYKNTTTDKYADSMTRGIWDVECFTRELNRRLPDSGTDAKTLIEAAVHAMYSSLNGGCQLPEERRVVEKSVDHAEYAILLKQMFPGAKFIHILRNPYSNLVSIRKFKGRRHYPLLKRIVQSMYNNYYYLEYNKRVLGDDYYIVKYEDLVSKSKDSIRQIVDFLGIENEPTLYRPTANNQLWSGNSTSNCAFDSISAARLDAWQEDVIPLEIAIVNRLFGYILDKYDYPRMKFRSVLFHMGLRENIFRYMQNRAYYRFYL